LNFIEVEGVIFDLDGTLVDSLPGIEHSARMAVSEVLPGLELPNLRGIIGPPIREVFGAALTDVSSDTLDELVSRFRLAYDDWGWKETYTFDGVPELLAELSRRRIACFVVTNKPLPAANRIVTHLGLSSYITRIVSRDSIDPPFKSKGDAACWLVETFGLNSRKQVFVGDTADDAEAARQVGATFVFADYGYGTLTIGSDASVIEAPVDLLTLLPTSLT
jgi:phosphoglycolate phosphatase